jgi:hypothetical protein
MSPMVSFVLLRNVSEIVRSPAEAAHVMNALLGPLDGAARAADPDGLGGWLVESSEDEAARLRVSGWWSATGTVGEDGYEAIAEMP